MRAIASQLHRLVRMCDPRVPVDFCGSCAYCAEFRPFEILEVA